MANSPLVIAEIGSNHGNSLDVVKRMIDGSKEAGCAFVKFQLFYPDEFIPDYVKASDYGFEDQYGNRLWQDVLKNELIFPHDWYPEVSLYCKAIGIGFGVTVHGPRSLKVALELNIDFIKVASMDMNYYQFLESLSALSCPVILSTGMATYSEIKKAISILSMKSKDVLMHCTSQYPATENNIMRIVDFKNMGLFSVGYSDHTEDSIAAIAALSLGSTWFEKHITLDKTSKGPDHAFAADMEDIRKYVSDLNQASELFSFNNDSELSGDQLTNRKSYRRSLVASRDLHPGHTLLKCDIDFKRPGTGFNPEDEDRIIGGKVIEFISKDEQFTSKNLELP